MEKTELNGYVYDFSVDYNGVAVADILNIQKYLTLIRLGFLRVVFFWGLTLHHISRRTYIISIYLYTTVKQSI